MNVNIFLRYFTKIINVGVFNNVSCDSKLVIKFMAIVSKCLLFISCLIILSHNLQ